jgi:hypothetical protein
MAKAKGMRRKNRQVKMTLSIPEEYDTEEDFMESLMQKMDLAEWQLQLDEDEAGDVTLVPVSKMQLGDIEIGPEDED